MRRPMTALLLGTIALAGCAKPAPTLPTAAVDRAAACAAVQAAREQEAVGATGHLSADAQERVLHYALLAGSVDGRFAAEPANAVIQRTPAMFDTTIKGKWQGLVPECAAAFPAAADRAPTLPAKSSDRALQCYALTEFMRKALAQTPGRYAEAATSLNLLADRLDRALGPLVKREGLAGQALVDRKAQALAAAASLGPPPAVIAACTKAYA